jgi:predicted RecB family nuclease
MTAAPSALPRSTAAASATGITVSAAVQPGAHGRLGGYFAKSCAERVAKDEMPLTYPPDLHVAPGAFSNDLTADGIRFEDRIGARLAAEAPAGSVAMISELRDEQGDRTAAGKLQKEVDTFAAYLNPDVKAIFNARIGSCFEQLLSEHLETDASDPDRISEPDLIVLGGPLANGLRAMHFIDVKAHKTGMSDDLGPPAISPLSGPFLPPSPVEVEVRLARADSQQLAHYHRHGATLGLTAPEAQGGAVAGVIGREEVIVWGDLTKPAYLADDPEGGRRYRQSALAVYDRAFAHRQLVIDNARARDLDSSVAALTFPERKGECAICPWMEVCDAEMLAAGNSGQVTLLPGMGISKVRPLYSAGIFDIGALARRDVDTPIDGISNTAHLVRQARVWMAGTVHLAPGATVADIPRADLEIDLDCEFGNGDELWTYMWGVRSLDRRLSGGQRRNEVMLTTFDDYSGTAAGECRVFVECWKYLQDQVGYARAQHVSVLFYHYNHTERTKMGYLARTYAGRPGVPTEDEVLEFFASGLVVDLYRILPTRLIWPTQSMGLKSLATWAGFTWADDDPGGANSMLWYRTACTDPDPAVRAGNVARLRLYNADDVAAQAHLRAWIHTPALRAPDEILATVESLPALEPEQALAPLV